jgi:hypothetical protein
MFTRDTHRLVSPVTKQANMSFSLWHSDIPCIKSKAIAYASDIKLLILPVYCPGGLFAKMNEINLTPFSKRLSPNFWAIV